MAAQSPIRARLDELLADEASADLGPDEQAELGRLLTGEPRADRDEMMRVAGLAQLALLKRDAAALRAMPASARNQLSRQAMAWNAARRLTPAPARKTRSFSFGPALGWYAAAALALVFVVSRFAPPPPAPAAGAQRAALIERAPDVLRVAWAPSKEPGFEGASGDVVWSSARQEGYLRLAGLPPNDRSRRQYQLWVVDPSRDSRPVDGGVFDVGPGGEAIIPIHAKLPVRRPTAFAITLEQAGGVVVSDGPMLLVAAVSS
jgi:anti-sigma-K factor RskA